MTIFSDLDEIGTFHASTLLRCARLRVALQPLTRRKAKNLMEYFTEILGIGEAVVLGHVADAVVAGAELGGCGIDADVADILCDADAELLLERAAEVGVGNAGARRQWR